MPATAGTKVCLDCEADKPIEEFHADRRRKDGRAVYCKPCASGRQKRCYSRWTPEQRDRHRERVLKYRYGLGLAEIQAMFERQEGCCAICGAAGDRPAISEKRKSHAGVLCVDHNHETGAVRGLLCANCNVGLGKFRDDGATMIRAAYYLTSGGAT